MALSRCGDGMPVRETLSLRRRLCEINLNCLFSVLCRRRFLSRFHISSLLSSRRLSPCLTLLAIFFCSSLVSCGVLPEFGADAVNSTGCLYLPESEDRKIVAVSWPPGKVPVAW
jgi:hypothetical protein